MDILSARLANALSSVGVMVNGRATCGIEMLVSARAMGLLDDRAALLKVPNLGKKCLREIVAALEQYDMKLPAWASNDPRLTHLDAYLRDPELREAARAILQSYD